MVDFLFRSFLQTGLYFHSYIHLGYKKLAGFSHLTAVLFFIGYLPLFTLNNVTLRKYHKENNLVYVHTTSHSFCSGTETNPDEHLRTVVGRRHFCNKAKLRRADL